MGWFAWSDVGEFFHMELSEKSSVFVFGTVFWSNNPRFQRNSPGAHGPKGSWFQSYSDASDLWPPSCGMRIGVATMGILSNHAQSQVAGPLLLTHPQLRFQEGAS